MYVGGEDSWFTEEKSNGVRSSACIGLCRQSNLRCPTEYTIVQLLLLIYLRTYYELRGDYSTYNFDDDDDDDDRVTATAVRTFAARPLRCPSTRNQSSERWFSTCPLSESIAATVACPRMPYLAAFGMGTRFCPPSVHRACCVLLLSIFPLRRYVEIMSVFFCASLDFI